MSLAGLTLLPDAHEGYVDWERSEAIRRMIADNTTGIEQTGAAKRGAALLGRLGWGGARGGGRFRHSHESMVHAARRV